MKSEQEKLIDPSDDGLSVTGRNPSGSRETELKGEMKMVRYHIFKDGTEIGSTSTRENAIDMIRSYQARETHYMLRAEFSIIKGEVEFVGYK